MEWKNESEGRSIEVVVQDGEPAKVTATKDGQTTVWEVEPEDWIDLCLLTLLELGALPGEGSVRR